MDHTTNNRLNELLNLTRDGKITDSEFAEMEQLTKAKRQSIELRLNAIKDIRDKVEELHLSIDDIYTKDEILEAARVIKAPKKEAKTPSTKRVPKDVGYLLIEAKSPTGRGPASRFYHGQDIPKIAPKSLKALDDGNLEANLAKHYTEAGKKYFVTTQGKEELAKLIASIKASA